MRSLNTWAHRFRARWRKWWRDPAAFADELPSPPLRSAAVFGVAGFTLIFDAVDRRDRKAALAWKRAGVSLNRAGSEAHEFRFVTADGRSPPAWPQRVLVESDEVGVVVVAFAEGGGRMTAAEVRPGRPGVISLSGAPARAEVYRIDSSGALPERFAVRPLNRAGLAGELMRGGTELAQALRSVWPPMERRPAAPPLSAYRGWIARNEPRPAELEAMRARLATRTGLPAVSVLMPVHDPRPAHLQAAIESVLAQVFGDWRLCIVDDGSVSEEVRRLLDGAATDPRVRLTRHGEAQGVAAATNAALALAEGEIAVFLDHDDVLAPHALALTAEAFAEHPEASALYSDEDTLDARGRRSAPAFKPDLDRERLLAHNYVNHLFAVRLDLLRRLGGVRTGFDGAQDHDLVLRVIEAGEGPVLHLPHVLYHWRIFPGGGTLSQRQGADVEAARERLVQEHLARTGRTGAAAGAAPSVLAVIPTRDRPGLLQACVAGLLEQTDYPALEVCVVDNGSRTDEALALLERLSRTPRVRVLRIDAPFNFSALNNAAVQGSQARLLAFVNDDVMVVEPGWLKAMAELAVVPDAGAVGAKLFYPDGRIQHAGIVLGIGPQRVAGHEFRGAPGDAPGPQNRLLVTRETSAVTAACMVVERRKFEAVGGFDEAAFPVAFNDVDLCLRLAAAGWRTLWTPRAQLMHLESATRGSDRAEAASARFAAEALRMQERWGQRLRADPYYNPNLTQEDESFALATLSRG